MFTIRLGFWGELFTFDRNYFPSASCIKILPADNIKPPGILASEEAEIMLKMLKSRETDVDPDAENEAEGVNWGFRFDSIFGLEV